MGLQVAQSSGMISKQSRQWTLWGAVLISVCSFLIIRHDVFDYGFLETGFLAYATS